SPHVWPRTLSAERHAPVDDRERRRGIHRAGSLPDRRTTRTRLPRGRRHGEDARAHDGAGRVRHLSHGYCSIGTARGDEARGRAARAYLMAVAGNADPRLGYMTTSFREHPELKRRAGRQATSAMTRRLEELGVSAAAPKPQIAARLSALYEKAGGSRRSLASL